MKYWNGMNQSLLDVVEIKLGLPTAQETVTVYINVYDNSLSRKWLAALNELIAKNYHLEKNYCFLGFADSPRNSQYLVEQINRSINAINQSNIGYYIDDHFTLENSVTTALTLDGHMADGINHDHFNQLHRYFEDLQGGSGHISNYYWQADNVTRWHIRQLNLLCHEFESWQLSWRKKTTTPEWQRPSQLMCWLNAPRFALEAEDLELFGIDTINRSLGGVYVGVNKAVGKHHWEVFQDEGRDSRIGELTTTSLKSQTEAAGDFDIEWANNPGAFPWQIKKLNEFKKWLSDNGFNPEDKTLTIGHPQVGQVDLVRSFDTENYQEIWAQLNTHLNVHTISTSKAKAEYEYTWADLDYMEKQIKCLG
jgi:hypothetical protein